MLALGYKHTYGLAAPVRVREARATDALRGLTFHAFTYQYKNGKVNRTASVKYHDLAVQHESSFACNVNFHRRLARDSR